MSSKRGKKTKEREVGRVELEIALFRAIASGIRPIGDDKHQEMAKLQQSMQDSLRVDISQDELWAMLGAMYDLEALDERDSTIVNPTDTPPRPTKRQRKSRRAASTATSPLPTYSTHDASINESDTPPEDAQAVEALLPALELASLPAPNAVRQYPPLPTRNRAASISMLPPFGPSPSSLFSQTIYDVPSHFDPSIERVPHFAASSSSNSDLHNRAALPGTTSGSTGSPASVIVRTPQTDARSIIRGMASSMVHPTRTSSSASGSMLPPASTSASSASRRMMWSRDGKSVAGDNLQGAMSAMEEAVSREQEIDKVVDEREVQHGRRSALDQLLTNRID